MRPWSVTRKYTDVAPPPFPRPALRKRKRGISSLPEEINFPKGSKSQFFFFFFFFEIDFFYILMYTSHFWGLVMDLLSSHHWTQMEKL